MGYRQAIGPNGCPVYVQDDHSDDGRFRETLGDRTVYDIVPMRDYLELKRSYEEHKAIYEKLTEDYDKVKTQLEESIKKNGELEKQLTEENTEEVVQEKYSDNLPFDYSEWEVDVLSVDSVNQIEVSFTGNSSSRCTINLHVKSKEEDIILLKKFVDSKNGVVTLWIHEDDLDAIDNYGSIINAHLEEFGENMILHKSADHTQCPSSLFEYFEKIKEGK